MTGESSDLRTSYREEKKADGMITPRVVTSAHCGEDNDSIFKTFHAGSMCDLISVRLSSSVIDFSVL